MSNASSVTRELESTASEPLTKKTNLPRSLARVEQSVDEAVDKLIKRGWKISASGMQGLRLVLRDTYVDGLCGQADKGATTGVRGRLDELLRGSEEELRQEYAKRLGVAARPETVQICMSLIVRAFHAGVQWVVADKRRKFYSFGSDVSPNGKDAPNG